MGQETPLPFQHQMTGYQKLQHNSQQNTTIIINKQNKNQCLITKCIFTQYQSYEKYLSIYKSREIFNSPSIQKLIKHQTTISQNLCTRIYQLYGLWEYQQKTLHAQLSHRQVTKKQFTQPQMLTMIVSLIDGLHQFQQNNIIHQKLSVDTIKINQKGSIIINDPLCLNVNTNFSRVFSKHQTDRIYLSPEQCTALQVQNFCMKSSKNDIWTCGMIILQIGLLEDQNNCYRQNCRKINWIQLSQNIQKFNHVYHNQFKNILQSMIAQCKKDRPTWKQLKDQVSEIVNKNQQQITIPQLQSKQNISKQSPQLFSYLSHFSNQQPQIKNVIIPQPQILPNKNNTTFIQQPHPQHHQTVINYTQKHIPTLPTHLFTDNKQNIDKRNIDQKLIKINTHITHPFVIRHQVVGCSPFPPKPPRTIIGPSRVNVSKLKRYELIKKFANNSSRIGYLFGGNNPNQSKSPKRLPPTTIKLQHHHPLPSTSQQPLTHRFINPQIKTAQSLTYEGDINNINSLKQKNSQKQKYIINSIPKQQKNVKTSSNQTFKQNTPNQLEYVVQNFTPGSRYEGFKLKDMRHGKGKFYYQDGGLYDGEWEYNKLNGYGILYYQSGALAYQGNWKHDQFSGQGKLNNEIPQPLEHPFDYTDFNYIGEHWKFYEGQFFDDMKQGKGKLMLTNNEYFIGNFQHDMIQGNGIFFGKNSVIRGLWQANRLIKKESVNQ